MSAASKNGNDLLLGVVLIMGAFWYSKNAQGRITQPRTTNPPLGTGSMPSTVGNGAAQVLGGAAASFLNSLFSQPAVPITGGGDYYNYLTNGSYLANQTISEQTWDQKTPDVFVPGSVSTTGQDQVWTVG